MARQVPYEHRYEVVENINRVAEIFLYISVFISVGVLALTKKWVPFHNEQGIKILTGASILLSIAYFISDIVANYLFQAAEDCKRKDLVDHSVSTQLADENSNEYFTNHSIPPGIYKLGVNSFESCFFTKNISEKMIRKSALKVALVLFIFMAAVIWTDNDSVVTILQMALPFTILQQFIRLLYYRQRLTNIYESFVTIFQMPKNDRQSNLLLHNSMNYDATHAWASIKLPSMIYRKLNPKLTPAWAALKHRLKI